MQSAPGGESRVSFRVLTVLARWLHSTPDMFRRLVASIVFVFVGISVPLLAAAEPPPTAFVPPKRTPKKERPDWVKPIGTEWYGLRILAADALAFGFAYPTDGATLVVVPLAAPTLHLMHGEPGKAGISFLLRAGIPLAIGYGMLNFNRENELQGDERTFSDREVVTAMAIGMSVGVIYDLIAARRDVFADELPASERRPGRRMRWSLTPTVSPLEGGAVVGLGGTF